MGAIELMTVFLFINIFMFKIIILMQQPMHRYKRIFGKKYFIRHCKRLLNTKVKIKY